MKQIKIIGYKCGMTTYFTENGNEIPVTIIKIPKNNVLEIKNEKENISSIKIGIEKIKEKNLKKPLAGIYKKYKTENFKFIKEIRVNKIYLEKYNIKSEISINIFKENETINVTALSKGKGFAGTIKRHNFKSQKASHGNSLSHRVPGSIGQCQDPGRVFKGKKMSGHLGVDKITIKNIIIIKIYENINAVLLKGSVPGANGTKITLKKNLH